MTTSLRDRVVVVTGGARGIGRAFVEGFLQEGAKVAALDLSWQPSGVSNDRDDSYSRAMRARDDVLVLTADITSEEQVQAAYEATIAQFGTVDALVNSAGMLMRNLFEPSSPPPILGLTNDHFRKMYEVNVFGTLTVTRKFIQPMLAQQRGSILSVISNGALMKQSGGGYVLLRPDAIDQPYQSSKAAITNIMCYLASEVRARNVAVNVVVPGHTRSTGFDEWLAVRTKSGGSSSTQPVRPEHVLPLGLFLAQQDAVSGNTGKIWEALVWNQEHGAGGAEQWRVP